MPKNSFADWDTTASNNTDIAGIDIQGTAAVQNFDNALRTLMAQLKSGVSGLTLDNTFSGANTFTATQTWAKGADVASATALTLGTDGNYFDITGTTSITSITTIGAGTVVKLHFDGILTLTHHATDLILPGGANITTAAGDEAEFVEYATGDWRCTNYQRAVSPPVIITPWVQYTPTWVGFGTVAAGHVVRSRRVGGSLETQFQFTIGTATAVTASMTLGFNGSSGGVTVDAAAANGVRIVAGPLTINVAFAASYYVLASGGAGLVEFGAQTGSVGGLNPTTGSGGFGSGVVVSGSFSVPITGWN